MALHGLEVYVAEIYFEHWNKWWVEICLQLRTDLDKTADELEQERLRNSMLSSRSLRAGDLDGADRSKFYYSSGAEVNIKLISHLIWGKWGQSQPAFLDVTYLKDNVFGWYITSYIRR